MSTTASGTKASAAPVENTTPRSRVILASLIGTTIEFYDFYIYATAAVAVFPVLFFPAKDATTVLIRVRALGSYYDALTHVRRNGFWEQARTFELIPETLLDIPALKTDSYSEGEGSPLAMSLTFTPGVPVQAAFDYANEQAFVSYPRPLDAERYVEELRMFPRLGSKIPAHMTSALSHWNL